MNINLDQAKITSIKDLKEGDKVALYWWHGSHYAELQGFAKFKGFYPLAETTESVQEWGVEYINEIYGDDENPMVGRFIMGYHENYSKAGDEHDYFTPFFCLKLEGENLNICNSELNHVLQKDYFGRISYKEIVKAETEYKK